MTLEATTNAIEDQLNDSISSKLSPGASYITAHRSVSLFPQGVQCIQTSDGNTSY